VTILDDAGATVCVCAAPQAAGRRGRRPGRGGRAEAAAEPELIRKTKEEGEEEEK
jgi:hypothetical protein